MSFAGKVIIVTGASSGIGADAAIHLAKLGGKVSLVGRNEKLLKEVVEQITKNDTSANPLVIVADVTKDGERIIDKTVNHFGKLDILINNAGIFQHDSVNDFNVTLFDDILNTNLRGVFILTSLAVPHLEKSKGNIVNVSSVAGVRSVRNTVSYCVSKAALDQFTKCTALDLAPKGVRVNSINPAVIRTPIFEKTGMSVAEAEKFMEEMKKGHPIGRIGVVSDTSSAIEYIAGENATFITGVLLAVDGGFIIGGEI